MHRINESPGSRILSRWNRLSGLPGGKALFSYLVGRSAPYTGTLGAQVQELTPGHCRVVLRDRHRVRNHLNSVHAVALTNLGEMASGLAMLSSLPKRIRAIVVRLDTEYLKKGRGRLTAECRCSPPQVSGVTEHRIQADIRDRDDDLVARVTAIWRLAPQAEDQTRGG